MPDQAIPANSWTLLQAANYAAMKVLLSLNAVENTALSTWGGSENIVTVGMLTGGATGAGFTIALTTSTVTGTLPTAQMPALTGDVTTSAGAVATTIANLAVTNSKIANSTIDLTAKVTGVLPNANTTAASANTASAIVTRDGSGNFIAGTITAALTGNSSTATTLATGRTLAVTGDLAWTSPSFDGSGNVTAAGTLATVNANTGSFGSSTAIPTFTVNGKGLITAASTAVVIAPAGTLSGATLASGVTASSLTSLGTLTSLGLSGAITGTQSIGPTTTDGLLLTNTTAAANNAQQWSPRVHWAGKGWATGGAGSLTTEFWAECQPVQGSSTPTANWILTSKIGSNSSAAALTISNTGVVSWPLSCTSGTDITVTNGGIGISTGGTFSVNSRTKISSPADGVSLFQNNGFTDFTRIDFGGTTNSFSAIGRDAVNGFTFQSAAGTATWNDSSTGNSGTVANRYMVGIAAPTLTSTGTSVTDTVASTFYIGGAPTASTNTTIGGTPWALNVAAGPSNFGGPIVLPSYTVATLPSTAAAGKVTGAFVVATDLLTPTFLTAAVGGGATVGTVLYNGTAWVTN